MTTFQIRPARREDAKALLAIYQPFVEKTAITFEITPPSEAEFVARIEKNLQHWQWLVAEQNGKCLGYAYGSQLRERAAFQWSVEVSVYVDPASHGKGVARALYEQLFSDLASKGYCMAFAAIAQPNRQINVASEALHRSLGFSLSGIYEDVGWKFEQWHHLAIFQKRLREWPIGFEPSPK